MFNKYTKKIYQQCKLAGILAISVVTIQETALAETLIEHAQSCVDELRMDYASGVKIQNWKIPDFDCRDGVVLPTSLFGAQCDAEAQLLSINYTSTGDHFCLAGSRLGRLDIPNEDVKAVFICRKDPDHNLQPVGEPVDQYFSDIAMIITNTSVGKPESGKTCFFQQLVGKSSPEVASPQASFSAWQTPGRTSRGGGNCIGCHRTDAFIVTPHVVGAFFELGVLPSKNLKSPYSIVGKDFLPVDGNGQPTEQNWNRRIQEFRSEEPGCANACHYGTTTPWTTPLNEFALQQGWMGPGQTTTWTHYLYDILESTGPEQRYNSRIIVQSSFDYPGTVLSNAEGVAWRWHEGPTPSAASAGIPTGPYGSEDRYLYVETSNGDGMFEAGSIATAETQTYNFSNSVLSFDYSMYGADIGTLEIQMQAGGNWVTIDQIPPDNQFGWQHHSIDISEYGSYFGATKLRFKYIADGGYKGDIAIDNLLILRKE